MKVKILGISGSHRKERNTSFLVNEALEAAKEAKGEVETEFIELAGKDIRHCAHCEKCEKEYAEMGYKAYIPECGVKDFMQEVYPKIIEADGIVIGSPVFISTVSSRTKAFLDRLSPLMLKRVFQYKVGGAIAVAYFRDGGQDLTVQDILNSMRFLGFITVSGLLHGGTGVSGPPFGPHAGKDVEKKIIGVKTDEHGIRTARILGRRVADVCLVVKGGRAALGK